MALQTLSANEILLIKNSTMKAGANLQNTKILTLTQPLDRF